MLEAMKRVEEEVERCGGENGCEFWCWVKIVKEESEGDGVD